MKSFFIFTFNFGNRDQDGGNTMGMSLYSYDGYMFLASVKEVGFNWMNYQYNAEGNTFDYFVEKNIRSTFMKTIGCSSSWWLRTANSHLTTYFYYITNKAGITSNNAKVTHEIVFAFVIG